MLSTSVKRNLAVVFVSLGLIVILLGWGWPPLPGIAHWVMGAGLVCAGATLMGLQLRGASKEDFAQRFRLRPRD